MLIRYSDIQINVESVINDESAEGTVLLLHGFTGNSNDWMPVIHLLDKRFSYFLIDLIGHGRSDSPKDIIYYNTDSIINQLKEIILSLSGNKVILGGYSLGGRVALNFALKYESILRGLILESCSGGIGDKNLREGRIMQDEKLAAFIEANPIEKFIDYWMNIDLFNTQRRFSSEKLAKIRELKIENNRTGLANILRGFGTGRMNPVYGLINSIKLRTLLISGELDSKFTDINNEMVKLFPNAAHINIKNAGHNTHLEEPHRFIEVVNKYLSGF
jgi:2-succinyl-6-hydroxy-2,4-cyclohexadiene-1-carboxylate synthase